MKRIDINADVGESYGRWTLGDDEGLIRCVSSVNVACGLHAGDWDVMARTVALAVKHNVAVGAHPSYPDLQGFGRRRMALPPAEVSSLVLYQIGALWAIARSCRADIVHVKPHGALYNDAMKDIECAAAIAKGIKAFSRDLLVFCLPGSSLAAAASECGLVPCLEGFADRLYEPNGSLSDRHTEGAVLDIRAATNQGLELAKGTVMARGGILLTLCVETLCIHGDSPFATATANALRHELEDAGFTVEAPGRKNDS